MSVAMMMVKRGLDDGEERLRCLPRYPASMMMVKRGLREAYQWREMCLGKEG